MVQSHNGRLQQLTATNTLRCLVSFFRSVSTSAEEGSRQSRARNSSPRFFGLSIGLVVNRHLVPVASSSSEGIFPVLVPLLHALKRAPNIGCPATSSRRQVGTSKRTCRIYISRIDYCMSNCCSHETLLHFSLQSFTLSIAATRICKLAPPHGRSVRSQTACDAVLVFMEKCFVSVTLAFLQASLTTDRRDFLRSLRPSFVFLGTGFMPAARRPGRDVGDFGGPPARATGEVLGANTETGEQKNSAPCRFAGPSHLSE